MISCFCVMLLLIGCSVNESTSALDDTIVGFEKKIDIKPDVNVIDYYELSEIPRLTKPIETWKYDFRSQDLSEFDLVNYPDELLYAHFDSKTVWPQSLPNEYDPVEIMTLGMNPGLGVRELHEKGITGKGVSVAIIDQRLLVSHEDYRDNLMLYEEINIPKEGGWPAQMHGGAVSSILMGKNCGVAPDAKLFYIALNPVDDTETYEWDFAYLAKAIDRVVEINEELPAENKIRVVSISRAWRKGDINYDILSESIEKAKAKGIYVVGVSETEQFPFTDIGGIGRGINSDPDDIESYTGGIFWRDDEYGWSFANRSEILNMPMDYRSTASPTGDEDYAFYASGGMSWSVPYYCGVYALACQVDPDITPERFWELATESKSSITTEYEGKTYDLNNIVNPTGIIEALQ